MNKKYKNFITVMFPNNKKEYHFGCNSENIGYGDFLVVETANGLELAEATSDLQAIKDLRGDFKLKPVIRKAHQGDIDNFKKAEQLGEKALKITQKHVDALNLDMNLISASYTLDHSKVLIIYVSDGRVDFRELLKLLNRDLRCRIELRQIGARDKAKLIGGIAPCGMETCCTRFKQDFDMISINMAKNQNLALNIPKLSGMCGKFKCCLKHEDDLYTEIKKDLPAVGDKVMFQGTLYTIATLNLVSGQMKLVNDEESLLTNVEDAVINNPQFKTKEQLHRERVQRQASQRGQRKHAKNK